MFRDPGNRRYGFCVQPVSEHIQELPCRKYVPDLWGEDFEELEFSLMVVHAICAMAACLMHPSFPPREGYPVLMGRALALPVIVANESDVSNGKYV